MFDTIHSTRPGWLIRTLCIFLSMTMLYSVAAAGIHSAFQVTWLQAEQAARRVSHFSENAKPLRPNFVPRRDTTRGIWNAQNLAVLRRAEQIERLHAPIGESDYLASIAPIFPMLLGDGGGEPGGGEPLPGEGGSPGGGSMPPLGVNTNTGNRKTTLPIVGWSARGQNGIDFTLYHNSKSDYMFDLGKGWSHSYDFSIVKPDANNILLRLGNGWVLPYNISAFTYYQWNEQTQSYDAHQGNAWSGPSQLPWLDVMSDSLVINRKDPANPVEYHLSTSYASPQDPNAIPRLAMVKDKYGNTTTISRNSAGRMTSVSDGTGRSLTFSGPLAGKMASVTAPTGKTWSFNYTGDNLTTVTYPTLGSSSPARSYSYNSTNDITQEIDLRSQIWSYTYNANQELASATDPLGKTWLVNWNGGTVTVTSPLGRVTTDVYNNGVLAHHTDEAGFFESYAYDPHNQVVEYIDKRGKVSKIRRVWRNGGFVVSRQIDALNRVTTFTHNSSGTVASITDPLNRTVTATYDANNDIISAVDPLGRTAFVNTYNGFGELTSVQDGMGRTASISRDSYGNVVQAVDPANVVSTATYNLLGVPLSATDGAGSTYSLGYDNWFRPVQVTVPGNATSSLSYDFEGNVVSATDPLNRTGTRQYNARGEVISTTNAKGESHSYSYNDDGLLTAVTNGRNFTRTYNHTLRGEVTSLTLPDGAVEQWAYDANGSTTGYTNPLGQTILYNYDDVGRLTKVDYPLGTDTTFNYDGADRLLSMLDSTGQSSWAYNAASEVTSLTTPQGVINYAYSVAGQRTSMTQVGTGVTTYSYDSAGRSSNTTDPFGDNTSYSYDSAGRLSKRVLANGTYEAFLYDAQSRVSEIRTMKTVLPEGPDSLIKSRAYTFDLASQVTSVVEGGITTSYGYDLAGQLASEAKSSGYTASYTYDANGNRLSRNVNGVTENYSYDAGDKLLSVSGGVDPRSFVYDAAGRTTSIQRGSGNTNFTYDYESRVTSITKPSMVTNLMSYNGLDTRVGLTDSAGTKTFQRDGVGVTAPVLTDGTAKFTASGENRGGVKTTFSSALKNTDLQTSASGAITAERQYDAFGNVIASSGAWTSQFGNAGRFGYQEDPDSSLKLLGHRYYDSSTGRFLTRDPIKDGRNWYAYCYNDPVRRIDPTGTVAPLVYFIVVGTVLILTSGVAEAPSRPDQGYDVEEAFWAKIDAALGFIDIAASIFGAGALFKLKPKKPPTTGKPSPPAKNSNRPGKRGKPAHQKAVQETEDAIKKQHPDWIHVAGGRLPEQTVPGTNRLPDLWFETPTGPWFGQIGKRGKRGRPVAREWDAGAELAEKGGGAVDYIPYNVMRR